MVGLDGYAAATLQSHAAVVNVYALLEALLPAELTITVA
jgi:hypothetical protein